MIKTAYTYNNGYFRICRNGQVRYYRKTASGRNRYESAATHDANTALVVQQIRANLDKLYDGTLTLQNILSSDARISRNIDNLNISVTFVILFDSFLVLFLVWVVFNLVKFFFVNITSMISVT